MLSHLFARRDQDPSFTRFVYTSPFVGNLQIYVMNADGRNQTRLTNNPEDDYDSDWGWLRYQGSRVG